MVKIMLNRQDAEALWDLLMEKPHDVLPDAISPREQMAEAVAEGCGFSHEKAREIRLAS